MKEGTISATRISTALSISLFLFVAVFGLVFADDSPTSSQVCLGIFADLHAHDTDSPGEAKIMVNYDERLSLCIAAMNAFPVDLVVQLGDLVNGRFVIGEELGEPGRILTILDNVEAIYAQFAGPRYYVLGNHDIYDLSKEEFLARVDSTSKYLSFDVKGYHFVILDAQYNRKGEDLSHVGWVVQGYIPPFELQWLIDDLATTSNPTIVFVHQRLDVDFDFLSGGPAISNTEEVKTILSDSGVVIAVFQGHDHENALSLIDGIHYVTFEALVNEDETPPSWAYVTLNPQTQMISITGVGQQADYSLEY